jgi:hypothetical protein
MDTQQANADLARRVREAAIRRFQMVQDRLCPLLEKRIAESLTTAIHLQMEMTANSIIVRGPSRGGVIFHKFTISDPSADWSRVLVRIFRVTLPQGAPSNSSGAEIPGAETCLLGVQNDLDSLEKYELRQLLDWLIDTSQKSDILPIPHLSGVLQREVLEEEMEVAAARDEAIQSVVWRLLSNFDFSRFPALDPRLWRRPAPDPLVGAAYLVLAIAALFLLVLALYFTLMDG